MSYVHQIMPTTLLLAHPDLKTYRNHTTYTVRNKHEKLEGKGEASFDTPFKIQSHAESIYK